MYKYGSDPAIIEWNRNLLATKFIEVVAKQLQKGLLKVNDNQNHKFKLQLPYLYTENTRKKFFPGYEDSNALLDIPEDYKTSSYSGRKTSYETLYDDINNTLRDELKEALNNLGYNYDSNNNKIEYIECINCDTNKSIVEIAFKFDNDPQREVPTNHETGETAREETEEAEEETTKEAPEVEKDERVGGRKSKKRRKSAKRRKSLK